MWDNPKTCLITFGEPRVGDESFAIKHDELIHPYRKLRFVNGLDPIPHIPFIGFFIHHSRYVYCNLTAFSIISGIPFNQNSIHHSLYSYLIFFFELIGTN